MAAQYALRVDYVRSADRGVLSDYLSRYATSYLAVYETHEGENPHVHCIFKSETRLAGLRTAFKRAFPTKNGNGAYSLKPCTEDFAGYIDYMCKGVDRDTQPVVELRQGLDYTDEAIAAAHGRYWVNNEALVAARKVRSIKADIVEAVEKACKDKGVRYNDRVEIAKEYIRIKKAQKKGISIFAARAVVNTVALLLDDSSIAEEELAIEVARF